MDKSLFNPPANNRQNFFMDQDSDDSDEMEIEGGTTASNPFLSQQPLQS
jgi:hypothetical protein